MKQWIIQFYDENGEECKEPRRFKGSEDEVKKYINERFSLVDKLLGRTTKYYEVN